MVNMYNANALPGMILMLFVLVRITPTVTECIMLLCPLLDFGHYDECVSSVIHTCGTGVCFPCLAVTRVPTHALYAYHDTDSFCIFQ